MLSASLLTGHNRIKKGCNRMTTQNIPIFKALGAKMDFLDQRMRVLSRNIANADTPNYQPRDLKPVDFGAVLKGTQGSDTMRPGSVLPVATHAGHMHAPGGIDNPKEAEQKRTYESAPSGNAVILEEQLIATNHTIMEYNMATNLYQKNVSMMRTALGRNQ
jgi:flagellar basal-body rod protein FlgB